MTAVNTSSLTEHARLDELCPECGRSLFAHKPASGTRSAVFLCADRDLKVTNQPSSADWGWVEFAVVKAALGLSLTDNQRGNVSDDLHTRQKEATDG